MNNTRCIVLMFIICAMAVHAITINSVTVTPQNATTTATLSCLVSATAGGTLNANITWYRNGALHATDNEVISLTSGIEGSTTLTGNIEGADTTKADTWLCQTTVYNGSNSNASNSSVVTIVNSPPILSSPTSTQTVYEDNTYSVNATVNDADGDAIVTWISSDLNSSLYSGQSLFTIGATGAIAFSPAQAMVGNHTMAILAYDGESFGGQNVLFEIIEVNDPPVFTVIPVDRNATVGENFTMTVTGSDEESDPFNFSMDSSNPNLVLNITSNTTATISFIGVAPTVSDVGLIYVNITAYEIANSSVNNTADFTINVTMPNQEPVLDDISNQTGTQGQLFTLYFNATDNDTLDTLAFNASTNCTLNNPWTVTTVNNTSSGGQGLINLTLNNSHVACPYVTIAVYDFNNGALVGGSDSKAVFFNITNVNDAPEIYNASYNISNSQQQQNIYNLSAGTGAPFVYQVNGTDVDQLTYAGDNITFTDNSTLFVIDATTGIISFTPSVGEEGNYLIEITLTDAAGLNDNETLNLTILLNYPPQISSPGTIICQEDSVCAYNVSATDNDAGENLTFTSNSSLATFIQQTYNISQSSGTLLNGDVGNHTINLTVADRFDHENSTTYLLVINNTNDAPFFDSNLDSISDTLTAPGLIVAGMQSTWLINITDVDFLVATENLTFTSNITTGTNTSLFAIVKNGTQQAYIQYTAGPADPGDYTVNITVTDTAGATASQLVNFTVQNTSNPPMITAVQPYTVGSTQTNSSVSAISNTTNETNVTFAENEAISFNLTYTDNDTGASNITIYWYREGNLITSSSGSTTNLSYTFDYFSAGLNNITATVQDNLLSSDSFTWHVTVTNVNRAPVLVSNFANRTINSTTTLAGEMENFIDPDDDYDSDSQLDINETNTLTFTMSSATSFTASFSGTDVTITPSSSAVETVTYTATDTGALTVDSNNVTYTVVYNPPESSSSSSSSSSSGGGGGGASSATVITRRVETPKPYALDIITPKPITIYENETVIAPLAITNTGSILLSEIKLHATSEANVTLSFLDDTIPELAANESYNTSLAITGFRYQGTYEVFVTAEVTSPEFNDTAVIYINSIERSREGAEAVNVKITYARDLLTENPACGELVQLVNQAEQAYRSGDVNGAEQMLGAVTEGCTYLKAQAAQETEQPGILGKLAGYRYTNVILAVLLIGLLVIGGTLVAHYAKQQ